MHILASEGSWELLVPRSVGQEAPAKGTWSISFHLSVFNNIQRPFPGTGMFLNALQLWNCASAFKNSKKHVWAMVLTGRIPVLLLKFHCFSLLNYYLILNSDLYLGSKILLSHSMFQYSKAFVFCFRRNSAQAKRRKQWSTAFKERSYNSSPVPWLIWRSAEMSENQAWQFIHWLPSLMGLSPAAAWDTDI